MSRQEPVPAVGQWVLYHEEERQGALKATPGRVAGVHRPDRSRLPVRIAIALWTDAAWPYVCRVVTGVFFAGDPPVTPSHHMWTPLPGAPGVLRPGDGVYYKPLPWAYYAPAIVTQVYSASFPAIVKLNWTSPLSDVPVAQHETAAYDEQRRGHSWAFRPAAPPPLPARAEQETT